jgi:hypothetical protein
MGELVQARKAFQQAEARVEQLQPLRRNLPGPGATAVPSPSAIAQIPSAAPGPGLARDPETRGAKQRGRQLGLEALRDGARQHLGEVSKALRDAEDTLPKAREDFDTALAGRAQADQAARQNRLRQRDKHATRRKELSRLDAAIDAARAELRADPVLQGLIDPQGLQRVIERHVNPDDDALRRFPELFAARTQADFERAAQAAHPSYDPMLRAPVNIPHEHGLEVGQGYDAKIDRTDRLISLTRSEYGVAWGGDRAARALGAESLTVKLYVYTVPGRPPRVPKWQGLMSPGRPRLPCRVILALFGTADRG